MVKPVELSIKTWSFLSNTKIDIANSTFFEITKNPGAVGNLINDFGGLPKIMQKISSTPF